MQPYKLLIADDEPLSRLAIKIALPQDPGFELLEATNGAETVEKIGAHLPHILFLDIQMPVFTGLEVLRKLPAHYSPYIIIVSAHDRFALQAYEHDASDYLLKPFSQARFDKAFRKACSGVSGPRVADYPLTTLHERLTQMLPGKAFKQRLSIRDGAKISVVPCAEVLYIEASGEYTAVHTASRKYLHHETLAALELALDPAQFARIHRSAIVNIGCIKELVSQYNGDYMVALKTGQELKLSRNYREQVLQLIG